MARLGIYLIGARGNVAACAITGALAFARNKAAATGLVTGAREFAGFPLAGFDSIALGGCDIAAGSLVAKARTLATEGRMLPPALVDELTGELDKLDKQIDHGVSFVPGTVPSGGYAQAVAQIRERLEKFKARTGAERVVVVNLASTEAVVLLGADHESPEAFAAALKSNRPGLTTCSMLYAWAAFEAGMGFVNFTPSQANDVIGISEFAMRQKVPHAGKDGKTGETLLKTVLGPMFVARNLRVLSWIANNYLGNDDGKALADPARRETKLASKDAALRSLLNDDAYLSTDIGYAPSLDDWKTAWDLIHFEGFLGTRMTMQFTWQGCDSALAAPLVLDLARLMEYGWRRGEHGAFAWLASFFKSPLSERGRGPVTHDFAAQLALMKAKLAQWRG